MNQLATPTCVTSDNLPKDAIVRAKGLFGQGPREAAALEAGNPALAITYLYGA